MSSKFNAAARSATLAAKSVDLNFKETKVPDNSVDLITSIKANSSAAIKMANYFTIDVFPNFVPILMFIMFNCSQTVHSLDSRMHSKVTLPTYIFYCLNLVYGFFLLSDMHIRPSPSPYANNYFSDPARKQFADLLLSLPVPIFLEPLLATFHCTTAIHSGNIIFCPSAAGLTLETHFGRFFPTNMFLYVHNVSAELNSRITPSKVTAFLHSRTLFTLSNTAHTDIPAATTIANLLGSIRSTLFDPLSHAPAASTFDSYASAFRQSFDSTFNPVLSRDYTRRAALAYIPFTSPTFPTHRMNPYDLLFCFSASNFNEFRIVLQSVAATMNGSIPCTSDLAKIIGSPSGKSILQHGYSTFGLPTWHSVLLSANSRATHVDNYDHANNATETRQSPEDTATDLLFLVEPDQDLAAHATAHTLATALCNTTPAHPVTVTQATFPRMIISTNDIPAADPVTRTPAESDFITFSEFRDTAPLVNVLEPVESSSESAWKATTFGMIIESFEIDASAVPHPNPEAVLAAENARFAESAIAYNSTVRATLFDTLTRHIVRTRTIERRNMFKAATILYDFSKMFIPRPLRHTIDDFVNNGLPGFTAINDVNWIRATNQFFGIRLASVGNTTHADHLPANINPGRIYVWSPYTFNPVQDPTYFLNNRSQFPISPSLKNMYFITNLRTLFGSDPQLIEVQHIFNSFPSV
jgi:hypothetical protein